MCLFVIDEEMKLLKIIDNGEGKAVIVAIIDMEHHDLEDELETFMNQPWTSIAICDRMLSFGEHSFSLQTKFSWEDKTSCQEE